MFVMFDDVTVALSASNKILPPCIFKSGKDGVVSSPSSVGLNGGEVSSGGQHKERSPSAAMVPVTVKFPPDAIPAVVAGLIVTVFGVTPVFVLCTVVPSANWAPKTLQPLLTPLASITLITVSLVATGREVIIHFVSSIKQNAAKLSLISPLD